MGELKQRLFLGIELDEEVRHALAASLSTRRGPLPGRAVPPPNWHVTLRFLGAASQVQREVLLGAIVERLDEESFSIRFGGLGAFPRPTKASVLFVEISAGAAAVGRLAVVCDEAAIAAGFASEERPFHPHATLARIRPPQNVAHLIEEFGVMGARQDVAAITLYASHLGRGGARYDVVDRIPLLPEAR